MNEGILGYLVIDYVGTRNLIYPYFLKKIKTWDFVLSKIRLISYHNT